jgi:TolB-like protein/DNA-binding winged helix-turn-helix (wHTH) protein/Tfp pilus assembly protein PilF
MDTWQTSSSTSWSSALIYRFDRFQADDTAFRLTADGTPVSLEPKTLRLLLYFAQNQDRLLRKQEILDAVWADTAVTENALTRSIGLLRKALDDDPREPRFIETVPAAGYRFIATVETLPSAQPATLAQPQPANPAQPALPRRRLSSLLAVLACFLLLFVAAAWLIASRIHRAAPIHSLAVLPLDNLSGDPSQDYLADGMTDELITEIARIPNLRVVSRTSVIPQKNSRKSLPEIARELNVDAIVEGSAVRSGDRVRITAQLIDARTDRHLWAESFEAPATDVISLQDSIAQQIASQARLVLLPPPPRRPINPAAHDAYLRGRYFFHKQDFPHSIEYYQQAIALDPNFASAYAGYATAYEASAFFGFAPFSEVMPKALAAAKRAIELDPQNGEAYTELGSLQTIYEWNWPAAEQSLTRGIALNPNDSIAEFKYATYLDIVGRPQDAVIHARRAVELDPLSFFMNRRLGVTLYYAREYDAALAQLRRAAEMENQPGTVDNYVSLIYAQTNLRDEAVKYDLAALESDHARIDIASLRSAYQQRGWAAYWRARSAALLTLPVDSCTSYEIGAGDLRTGNNDHAIDSFNRALDQRCFSMTFLKVDPLFDPIRSDPRYPALLRRLNLR